MQTVYLYLFPVLLQAADAADKAGPAADEAKGNPPGPDLSHWILLFAVFGLMVSVAAGAIVTPLALPWLPGRAFSTKGITAGLAAAVILVLSRLADLSHWAGRLEILCWFLLAPAIAGFLAMNFTGASTYTSLSGVKKEMKWAVPFEIGACCIGLLMWMGGRFAA